MSAKHMIAINPDAHPVRALGLSLRKVMEALYAAEINCVVSSFWDAGFSVRLGDDMNGWRAEIVTRGTALSGAAGPLLLAALEHYPGARIFGFGGAPNEEVLGWSGRLPSHNDKFQCEFCDAEHWDHTKIEHDPACLVTMARAISARATFNPKDPT